MKEMDLLVSLVNQKHSNKQFTAAGPSQKNLNAAEHEHDALFTRSAMAHDQSVRSDRRLRELLDLLARKNASPFDAAVESQFYNDMLAYLLTSSSSHWWCTEAENTIAQESLWLFSLPDHESIQKYKQKLAEQLSSCVACVEQYHLSKPSLRERLVTSNSNSMQFVMLKAYSLDT